jgi:hypothetical protein
LLLEQERLEEQLRPLLGDAGRIRGLVGADGGGNRRSEVRGLNLLWARGLFAGKEGTIRHC